MFSTVGGLPSVLLGDTFQYSEIILFNALKGVQYRGGCSILSREHISTVAGYHKYCGGILSVLWKDSISTVEGYYSMPWRIFSNVKGTH